MRMIILFSSSFFSYGDGGGKIAYKDEPCFITSLFFELIYSVPQLITNPKAALNACV